MLAWGVRLSDRTAAEDHRRLELDSKAGDEIGYSMGQNEELCKASVSSTESLYLLVLYSKEIFEACPAAGGLAGAEVQNRRAGHNN